MNAAEFLDAAGPLLLADEARHNLALGIAGTVRDAPELYPDARFWLVDGAAALRTPPHNLVVARPRDEAALAALAAEIDDDLPGVTGAVPEVHDFARLWNVPARVVVEHGVYALDRVADVPRAAGSTREAAAADTELLAAWWGAFIEEAAPFDERSPEAHRRTIAHKLAADGNGIALWEDGGETVSLAGYGSPTPNGVRIGPVYTPPELRGRGYATSLVAELSQRLLDAGRTFCFLYTNAANPTANAIYERIGYRRVCESAALAFT